MTGSGAAAAQAPSPAAAVRPLGLLRTVPKAQRSVLCALCYMKAGYTFCLPRLQISNISGALPGTHWIV